jgi:hypothetical protein
LSIVRISTNRKHNVSETGLATKLPNPRGNQYHKFPPLPLPLDGLVFVVCGRASLRLDLPNFWFCFPSLCMGVRTLVGCLVWANNYFLHLLYCSCLFSSSPNFSLCILLLHPMDSSCGQMFIAPCFQWLTFFCSGIACGKASFWFFFCRVGAPPTSPEDGNRSSFRNVVFSVCRNPDDGQSPEA